MRINNVRLYNFGSYEALNEIDCDTDDRKRNIILFGGKNGAGKTTLFTALRLVLYGYKAFGYAGAHSFYNKHIIKLINNRAKVSRPTLSFVELCLEITNGQGVDVYRVSRKWRLDELNNISETFEVVKNGHLLLEEQVEEFEKFIMQIIPPELFDLFFFDGERIADFFLAEGGSSRIKKAFLTLCGYDTFDIMLKNFKRLNVNKDELSIEKRCSEADDNLRERVLKCEAIKAHIMALQAEKEQAEAQITLLDGEYKKTGGVTECEWNAKFNDLKKEERFRDEKKTWLKNIANDTIPFLILRQQMEDLYEQVFRESDMERAENFIELFSSKPTHDILMKFYEEQHINMDDEKAKGLVKTLSAYYEEQYLSEKPILQLSQDERLTVLYTIKRIKTFDVKQIEKVSNAIKKSMKKSKKIKMDIEKCNVNAASDYVRDMSILLDDVNRIKNDLRDKETELLQAELERKVCETEFEKLKSSYEAEVKAESIRDISGSAMLMLMQMQKELFRKQVGKVETYFKVEIHRLMRKERFIDDIEIDENFNIKVYRMEVYTGAELAEFIDKNGIKNLEYTFGKRASDILVQYKKESNGQSLADVVRDSDRFELPIELDISLFSNGEKQIFIMAFYKALMRLCNHELPFVIDTPFARIDTEHRWNIVNYFFKDLQGQVFILSTNEEINAEHIKMFEDRLAVSYTLVNMNDSKTILVANKYFGDIKYDI